jgi:hypothetical protein
VSRVPRSDDVSLAWASTSWLTLRGEATVGVVLDATRPSYSLGELAIPVSITFWDLVEVVARPALAVGFTADERRVFGGTLGVGPGVALVPLDDTLRFRAARWGF